MLAAIGGLILGAGLAWLLTVTVSALPVTVAFELFIAGRDHRGADRFDIGTVASGPRDVTAARRSAAGEVSYLLSPANRSLKKSSTVYRTIAHTAIA